ncbi:NUDIX domain-containing protein [Gordonia sp. VNQ95]|uniref:NUDIX hydrolase n=1 Tax=Gordonia TaxID=2053 RepID=UPI0032B5AFB5
MPAEPVDDDQVIVVSAVVLRDAAGALLTVRKAGSTLFMLPGGKPEPGETPRQTAVRECGEEIGVWLDAEELTALGEFTAAAANEAGYAVRASLFSHPAIPDAEPGAEIAEVRWLTVDPVDRETPLAPLLRDHVLPLLRSR